MTASIEFRKLEYFRQVATPFIARATKVDPVPWVAYAGPSTWAAYGYPAVPVFVLELDTRKVSAGKLVNDKNVLHDISTALGGKFQVSWKNTVGLGLMIDERPQQKVNLVEALVASECCMVVGPRGSGKTTLLQHVIRARQDQQVMVFDPKLQTSDKWLDAEVYGVGGNYDQMAGKLHEIVGVMEQGGYGRRTLVVVDEFWISVKSARGQDIAADVFKLVTLGREPLIDIIIGTHSELVTGLGIQGQGDLRDAFDIVRLQPGFGATFAKATLEEREAVHPGPFSLAPARIFLTNDEIKLVQWAVYRNGGSFSLRKMEPVCRHTEYKPNDIRKLAEDWEARGWLTPDSRDATGQRIGRRVTPELMRMAGIKTPSN